MSKLNPLRDGDIRRVFLLFKDFPLTKKRPKYDGKIKSTARKRSKLKIKKATSQVEKLMSKKI